jgi:hypothetical protein
MEWPWCAKGTFDVGFLSAIAADEFQVLLQVDYFFYFSGLGQFADMHPVVVRIGAEVVDVDKSSTHAVCPLPGMPLFSEKRQMLSDGDLSA